MSKPNAKDGPGHVSHITGRVNWQVWHLNADRAKDRLAALIDEVAQEFHVSVFAFVLMSNHFHLVVQSPPDREFARLTSRRTSCGHLRPWPKGHQLASVRAQFMHRVRSRMSRERQELIGVRGRFWDGQYDARTVDSATSFAIRIAYDHRNPVKAKMVAAPEDYRWSSARTWSRGEDSGIKLALDSLPFAADPAELHRVILEYQGSASLDGVDGLAKLLKSCRTGVRDLEELLRDRGIPIFEFGTAADGRHSK
jgi:REP element-mobilizing transposase RayT